MKKKYTIDDLPKYSPWPARLLGLEKFEQKHKNRKEVTREYEKEKWGSLLKTIEKDKSLSLKKIDELFIGHSRIIYFNNGKFLVDDAYNVHKKFLDFIYKSIIPNLSNFDNIIELGSGYGTVILGLAKKLGRKDINYFSTEFADSGIKACKIIANRENIKIEVGKCDITKTPITNIGIPDNSVIFTSGVTSIVPLLKKSFIYNLIKLKPKIVIHAEPIYEHSFGDNTYDLLRRRYTEINDYNRNLLTILKDFEKKRKIKILTIKPSMFGGNPFFNYSLIKWKPL